MAHRNFSHKQALEKEVKDIYAEINAGNPLIPAVPGTPGTTGFKKYGTGSLSLPGSAGTPIAELSFGTPSYGAIASSELNNMAADNTSWTIEYWIYPVTTVPAGNTAQPLFSIGKQAGGPPALQSGLDILMQRSPTSAGGSFKPRAVIYSLNRTGIDVDGITNVAVNNWYHIALTYQSTSAQSGTYRLFMNGGLERTVNAARIGSSAATPYTTAWLGLYTPTTANSDNTVQFNGYMDGLRITVGTARYTSAFTAPAAAYPTGGSDPNWSQVIDLLEFDGNLTDASTFPSTTTLFNSASISADTPGTPGTPEIPATPASLVSSVDFGVQSVTKLSDGVYELQLKQKFASLKHAKAILKAASSQDLRFQIKSETIAVDGKLVIMCLNSSNVVTAPAANSNILLKMELKDSSVRD